LAELFPYWPNFFKVLAGKQFGDLATLQLMGETQYAISY
jgi:hypothetical protein